MILETYRLAGISDIPLQSRAWTVIPFKVIPEESTADFDLESRKAGHGFINGPLKALRVHRVGHHGGKPIKRRIVPPLDGGIHHGRVVQMVPWLRSNRFHTFSLLLIKNPTCLYSYYSMNW